MLIPVSIIIPYFLQSCSLCGGSEPCKVPVQCSVLQCCTAALPLPYGQPWIGGGGASFAASRVPAALATPIRTNVGRDDSAVVVVSTIFIPPAPLPPLHPWEEVPMFDRLDRPDM